MKRKLEAEHGARSSFRPTKRQRHGGRIHLFDLSDELLLRTLSNLDIVDLTRCERTCQKLTGLARDNEIWRQKYYNHFVRPRARRIPGLQSSENEVDTGALRYSSRSAKWLEHSHLRTDTQTKWKHAYTIKYNWTRGRARTSEMQVGKSPGVLARVCKGRLFTADHSHGLRIWKDGQVVQTCPFVGQITPSAMAIDAADGTMRIAMGFTDGMTAVYELDGTEVEMRASASGSAECSIDAIALAWPYSMTMSRSKSIGLYQYVSGDEEASTSTKCLASLHSDAGLLPASLSLRKTTTTLVAGIAYAFNRFNTGWCLGLQEIRMDLQGSIMDNRMTSSVGTPMRDTFAQIKSPPQFTSRSTSTSPFSLHPQLMRAPNSLSYCGCYVLAGLSDNTLMVYTVTSTDDKLEINVGRRLWGHTSAVSAAEVTSTGKALSISAGSDEMRYWELEELLSSYSQKKTSIPIKSLSLLNDAIGKRGNGLGLAVKGLKEEEKFTRRCVSFDDERAIVVGERDQRQIISCFDFA